MKFLIAAISLSMPLLAVSQKPVKKSGEVTFHIVEKEVQKPFFRVSGTERFWTMEMSSNGFKFISMNQDDTFEVPYKSPLFSADGRTKTYTSHSDKHDMIIDIHEEKCSDGMTDTTYTHVVKLSIKKTNDEDFIILKGCGNFVPDKRLNEVWVLEQIKGKKVTKYDFGSELPYIDLYPKEKMVTGFGGCNRIKGNITLAEHNLMRFSEIIATKMACLSNNKENAFLEALQNADRYEIKDDKLILSNSNGIQAVLVKGT